MTAEKPKIDYVAMQSGDLLKALGDDASKWAGAFVQYARRVRDRGDDILDEDWLTTWFANAIEHSSDVRRWRREAAEHGGTTAIVEPLTK